MKRFLLFSVAIVVPFLQGCPGPYDSYRILERETQREIKREQHRKIHARNGHLYGDSLVWNESGFCTTTYRKNKIRRSVCFYDDSLAKKTQEYWHIKQKMNYRWGKAISITEYYWNGNKMEQKRNGSWKSWDENGKRIPGIHNLMGEKNK